jgi:hypothetical protein
MDSGPQTLREAMRGRLRCPAAPEPHRQGRSKLSLSREERERWIEALSSRIRRRVEILIGFDTPHEIETDAVAVANPGEPVSAHPQDDPRVTRPAPPPTNQGIEEEP